MKRFISLLISIPFIILIAAFAFRNAEPVSVDLFVFSVKWPLALFLLVALFLGVIIGYLFDAGALFILRKQCRQLKKKQETLQGLSGVLRKPDK
ncbi:hypothetical protein MNBD_GAMMA11-1051 [hydrothermal vent metagenome]|uniref:Lipopolysaccharide assembly protein A domain-containing protein n=1 Tax=hydrothermal vent metagenome TaxID=652676 RepID=A0A3B0X5L5_9ZZZZ